MAFQKTPSYLWQHSSGLWFLKRPIPPSLRRHYINEKTGKPRTHIVESLGTHSRAEAEKLKRPILRVLEAQFAHQASGRVSKATLRHQERLASLRGSMAEVIGAGGDDDVELVIQEAAVEAAQAMAKEEGREAASLAYKLAIHPDRLTLKQALADRHKGASTREQTKASEVKALDELLAFLKVADCLPESVTEDHALAYVDHLNAGELSHATKKTRLSCLSRLWDTRKVKSQIAKEKKGATNLWRGHDVKGERKSTEATDEEAGRPWTEAEMVKLFATPEPNDKRKRTYTRSLFRELYAVGFITGMRLDEITSLRPLDVSRVKGGVVIKVRQSKSDAGVREVPVVHPAAVRVLTARADAQTDPKGLLFSECVPGGPDNKTSWQVSKAMGRDRDRLSLREVTFHSTRGTFMTLQENAGTNVVHVQRYVGHVIDTLMHKTYSGGSSTETLRTIAEAVSYPAKVEAELAKVAVRPA